MKVEDEAGKSKLPLSVIVQLERGRRVRKHNKDLRNQSLGFHFRSM